MATLTSTTTTPPRPTSFRRTKKSTPRTEIWSSLLRQTRLAQARSRTQSLQHRDLLLLGGSPDDQRHFAEHYLARPPPISPATANAASRRDELRRKGEVRLSNRFAYGYGHVTLFSPPQQVTGASSLLGGEAEEVAVVECHCFAGGAESGYEETLRRLLVPRRSGDGGEKGEEDMEGEGLQDTNDEANREERRPSVAILMSWRRPWDFMSTIRNWFALLARSLLPLEAPKTENPLEVLKEYDINLTVVLQHVEAQEILERENYKDDTFDYISQCLRTALLPLNAGLVYTSSAPAPTQPGSPLSDVQKVLYTSLGLDVAVLQPRTGARPGSSSGTQQKGKDESQPKHNVVDRMAIVVPSGWDSVGKIRLLSETFSPESVMEGWVADLDRATSLFLSAQAVPEAPTVTVDDTEETGTDEVLQATGGAGEMYSSQPSPTMSSPIDAEMPMSPSKMPKSAIIPYGEAIQDPNAHKVPKPPQLEVTTQPEQEFLAGMRVHLQQLESQDAERQRKEGGGSGQSTPGGLQRHRPSHDNNTTSGGALSDLGDVSFNVGGVNFSAEAAIERLKRPQHSTGSSAGGESTPTVSTPRTGTPRPPKRDGREETPGTTGGKGELQTDKLEEYFASLMKRGGGGSGSNTPSKG